MSQNDMIIANADGATVRADINSALQALASTSKGNSRPSTPYAGQLWLDDNTPSSTVWTLYMWDGTDDIKVGEIDTTNNVFTPYSAALSDSVPVAVGSSDATKKARLEVDGVTAGQTRVMTVPDADGTIAYTSQLASNNVLINPTFAINQRLAASNADDTYAHDRWYVLTQTGSIAVSTLTDVENTTPFMARLTQSQVSAQRMGYAHISEGKYCKHLRGQTVNLSLRYRCSSSQAIRFAILEWTGTEDSVTSDVVNDWTSGTYTAGNFFLASNLTITSAAAATPSAATLTDYTVSATLGSSFNNLIVFVWTEGTAAQNVTLDLGKVKLERGSVATPFVPRPFEVEYSMCKRYYQKTFPLATAPAQNAGTTGAYGFVCAANTSFGTSVMLSVAMRTDPNLTTFNPSAANANWRDVTSGADRTFIGATSGTGDHFYLYGGSGVSGTDNRIHYTLSAEL